MRVITSVRHADTHLTTENRTERIGLIAWNDAANFGVRRTREGNDLKHMASSTADRSISTAQAMASHLDESVLFICDFLDELPYREWNPGLDRTKLISMLRKGEVPDGFRKRGKEIREKLKALPPEVKWLHTHGTTSAAILIAQFDAGLRDLNPDYYPNLVVHNLGRIAVGIDQ